MPSGRGGEPETGPGAGPRRHRGAARKARAGLAGPATAGSGDGLSLMGDLLTSLPAAVAYVAGPDLVFQFANEEYRESVGGRELAGRPYREALPELVTQPRFRSLERVLRTGRPFQSRESEVWLRRRGEKLEQVFIDTVYQPVRDASGQVAGVLLFGSNVTRHVRDRQRLAELAGKLASSENRYRTLFETLPHGIIHYARDGSILAANPAAIRILGAPPGTLTALRRATGIVHEDGTPFEPAEIPAIAALRTGKTVPGVVAGVRHGRTGELRWVRITAVPDARDANGRPQRAYSMLTDVTEQHQAEAAARRSSGLLERLRDANVLGVVASTSQGVYDANEAFLNMIGYTEQDVLAGRVSHQAISPPEWAGHDRAALAQLQSTGAFQSYDKEYRHRDGHRVPVMVGGVATARDPLRWVTFVVDLTAPQRAERERAALVAREERALAEAGIARQQLEFLLRAGDLVAATRNRDDLLAQVTRLLVPTLADYCVAFMPTPDGMLRATMLTHRDQALAEVLTRLRELPFPAAGPMISQLAFTTGITQLASEFSASTPSWSGEAPEIMKIVDQVGPASALAVPLLAGRRPFGVLVLGRGEGRSRFTKTDVAVAGELARRLATGLTNVETFARDHTVAETLQDALLPDELPVVSGLDIAVRYLPATDGVHVGGDWYDVFPLGSRQVGLAIGDVAGHSIASASVMGQIRGLLRAYAVDDPRPAGVLRRTDAAMSRLLPDVLATVCYAVLDLPTRDLTYANAGHPPPLLARGAGQAEYLEDTAGAMLGAQTGTTFEPGRRRLAPGTTLLLYTDGLIEDRRHDITHGLTALAHALASSAARTAAQAAESVQAALLGSTAHDDDVCILAARLTT